MWQYKANRPDSVLDRVYLPIIETDIVSAYPEGITTMTWEERLTQCRENIARGSETSINLTLNEDMQVTEITVTKTPEKPSAEEKLSAYKLALSGISTAFREAFQQANDAMNTIGENDAANTEWKELYLLFQHAKVGMELAQLIRSKAALVEPPF